MFSGGPKVGGYTAQCVEIPGAISQGRTLKEARANIADAIAMILEHRRAEAAKAAKKPAHFLETVETNA